MRSDAAGAFYRDNARWIAGGFLLTLFSSYGQTFYVALSSGEIRAEFSLTNGEFGWLYMAATLTGAGLIPFLGRLLDRTSVSAYAAFVVAGLLASMLLMALAGGLGLLFLALTGLRLFGQGLMSHTAMTATGRWFHRERGRAVATVALGHQLGESLAPISFVVLAAALGWRGAWSVNALILLAVVLPAVVLLARVPRVPSAAELATRPVGRQWTREEVVRDLRFHLVLAAILGPPVIGTMVFFHQVYLAEIRGWELAEFAGATPILSAAAIAMTLAAGSLIDRFGSARLLPAMLGFVAGANAVLGLWHSSAAIVLYMALMGASFGLYAPLFGAIWPELYGTKHLGAIKSLVTSLMVVGTALSPGISGWLIDVGVSYDGMIVATGAYALVAAAIGTFAPLIGGRMGSPS